MSFFSWLQRNRYQLLGVALILLAAGLAADVLGRRDPPGIQFGYSAGVPDGSPIRVQLSGAVVNPGVYDLRQGDRVIDAIAAAGGPSGTADLDSLNLARRIRDEEQLVVPAKAGSAGASATLAPGAKLNINAASQQQLDALPGIGEAYARRILDSRQVDGPYRSTKDLVDRKVVPASVFEQISELISVGP